MLYNIWVNQLCLILRYLYINAHYIKIGYLLGPLGAKLLGQDLLGFSQRESESRRGTTSVCRKRGKSVMFRIMKCI